MDQMIGRCKVVSDPRGVYNFGDGKNVESLRLLSGDRAVIVILQRIMTHWRACGPFFEFAFFCADIDCVELNPKKIPWSVDLRRFLLSEEDLNAPELPKDYTEEEIPDGPVYLPGGMELLWVSRFGSMPIQIGNADGIDKTAFFLSLSDDVLAAWLEGNRFSYVDPCTNTRMFWKMMQGVDENALQQFRKSPDKYRLHAIDRRIIEVEGVQHYLKQTWISKWSAGAEDMLQDHINGIEPGIFKEFDVSCPRCNLVQEVEFPLDLGFFSPSSRKRKLGKT